MRHPHLPSARLMAPLLLLIPLALVITGSAATFARTVERITWGNGQMRPSGSGVPGRSSISGDGRYVVFSSSAPNLVSGDTNGVLDVFVTDRQAGTLERISLTVNGVQRSVDSQSPSMSRDARYVAYASSGMIWVWDRVNRTTEQVSLSTSGGNPNSTCAVPAISADGRYVAYESTATNLVSGETNSTWDIFVRDRKAGANFRASTPDVGGSNFGDSQSAAISGNGRYVVFRSTSQLVNADLSATADIYLRDLQAGSLERVSLTQASTAGNGSAVGAPAVSDDGRYVAFNSAATNLVTGDANGVDDIFVRDRQASTTELVSLTAANTQGVFRSRQLSMSADGRYVAFQSASNFVPVPPNSVEHLFVRDRQAGSVEQVSVSTTGTLANSSSSEPSVSADGRYVLFASTAATLVSPDVPTGGVFLRDRQPGTTESVVWAHNDPTQPDRPIFGGGITADGRYVLFSTDATNLVPGDTNARTDGFIRDRLLGTTERLTLDAAGQQLPSGIFGFTTSSDFRYILFSTGDSLVAADTNGGLADLYLKDRVNGTLELISRNFGGAVGNDGSTPGWVSDDAQYVFFTSQASNLVGGDSNGSTDAFLLKRLNWSIQRLSLGAGGAELPTGIATGFLALDRSSLTFSTNSTNAVAGDTNGKYDLFVRDLASGTIERLNLSTAGAQANDDTFGGGLLGNGRYATFTTAASNLVTGDTNGFTDVFLRDRVTGVTERVSVGNDGSQANNNCTGGSVSADSRFFFFTTSANNLVSGDTNLKTDIFVRDRTLGTTQRISLTMNGEQAFGDSDTPRITPDARLVVFSSTAYDLLGPGVDDNGMRDLYLVAFGAGTEVPTATGQLVSTAEDTPLPIALTGSDPDGDPLGFRVVTPPQHGTLTGTGSSRTYTPAANYFGPDSFTFVANDGAFDSGVATISIMVTDVDDAPATQPDSYSTAEDTLLSVDAANGVLKNDSDVEGAALTAALVANAQHGNVALDGAGLFVYTPQANYHGGDTFTYRASDGAQQSWVTTVTLTVAPVNDLPVVAGQSVTTAEDTAKDITLSATDVDGDSLTYEVVAVPASGSLSGAGASLSYTPKPNYTGSDSFTFRANDGNGDSEVATVSITVTPVNDTPQAVADTYEVTEDQPLTINAAQGVLANDTDVDGTPLSAELVTAPQHGGLALNPDGSFTYTPDPDYSGADGFGYRTSDGTATSSPVAVTLDVAPAPDAPVAANGSATTNEDTVVGITLSAFDADGDPLAYTVVAVPGHGTLSGSGRNRTYTPEPNYHGADSFTFRASDGPLESNLATVSLTMNPVNDAPAATAQTLTTLEDMPLSITLAGTDVDGDPLTFAITVSPSRGALTGTGANRLYTPNANANGPDSFMFRVSDGTVNSASVTVNLNVTSVNDAPAAQSQTLPVTEDAPRAITLTATDVDGDMLTYAIVSGPASGALTGTGATRIYTPGANFTGSDSFTFRANDGQANSNTATINLSVNAVNDAPVAVGDSYSLDEDTSLTVATAGVLANDTDADGDSLTAIVVAQPAHGTLSLAGNGGFTYAPAANYAGPDSFTYKARDAQVESTAVTVSLTVRAVNDLPVAQNLTLAWTEDTARSITLAATDADQDSLTYTIAALPLHGTLTGSGSSRSYQPDANYAGTDTFTYKASDGVGESNTATVTLNIAAVNDTPTALAASVMAEEDSPKSIQLGATDADGDPLTFQIVSSPLHGALSGTGASRSYTPQANYHGPDQFTFRVSDGAVNSSTATVDLTVGSVNDPPVARAGSDRVVEAKGELTSVTLDGSASSDVDGDTLTYAWHLAGVQVGSGATPGISLPLGEHLLTLTITDPQGLTAADDVHVTVRDTTSPVLQVPATIQAVLNAPDGARVEFTVTATDALPGVTISTNPASGALFPLGPNTVSCTARDASGNTTTKDFQVIVTLPQNSIGEVKASGGITVSGKVAKLKLSSALRPGKTLKGSFSFKDPVTNQTIKSTMVTGMTIQGSRARIWGNAAIPRGPQVRFMIDAEDLGTARGADRFRLELSDGRVWGPVAVSPGSVSIR